MLFARTTALPAINGANPGDAAISMQYPETLIDGHPILAVSNLNKSFHTRRGNVNALSDVNMEVWNGEFVCVLGPSGCGKTTLLNILAGFESPDSGSVHVNSIPLENMEGTGKRNRVQIPGRMVIFQEPSLFPWLNVIENVSFGLRMAGINRNDREKKAKEFLELVGMGSSQRSYIHELSGGMKQRVALARALATDPDLLLMDEPFAALDPQTRRNLHGELLRIWSETRKTIIFITHNVDEAVSLADRVLVFSSHPGRVQREFSLEWPRPRDLESAWARSLITEIMQELCPGGADICEFTGSGEEIACE